MKMIKSSRIMIVPSEDNAVYITDSYTYQGKPLVYDHIELLYIEQQGIRSFPLLIKISSGPENIYSIQIEYKDTLDDIYSKICKAIGHITPQICSDMVIIGSNIMYSSDIMLYNPTNDPMVNICNSLCMMYIRNLYIKPFNEVTIMDGLHCLYYYNYNLEDNHLDLNVPRILQPGDRIRSSISICATIPHKQLRFKYMFLNLSSDYHIRTTSLVCLCIHKILCSKLDVYVKHHKDSSISIQHNIKVQCRGRTFYIIPQNSKQSVHTFYSILCDHILSIVNAGIDSSDILSELLYIYKD